MNAPPVNLDILITQLRDQWAKWASDYQALNVRATQLSNQVASLQAQLAALKKPKTTGTGATRE